MLRFGKTKVEKEEFNGAKKKTIKIWDVDVNNIATSKLVKTKNNSNHLIGYLNEVIRPLILILPKMSGYVKTFKIKDGDKDKDKNNKLISFCIDDDKLLEKYKTIWTKIEGLLNVKLSNLPVYNDTYIKAKIRIYGDKVYTNFRGLNVPEDGVECESLTILILYLFMITNFTCNYI